ncbi:hypothetical protein SELMODRAFT_408398 [Selaginella moellendorffii]|uniref:4-hydroxy-3-methylbut-2-enyl diphosphate reductase n=1 Tax=Selaginella moellendorffii TaxID=88036 RepID=D8R862_SELML|nr:hypothetical protein SELMODRAFT_408398 [Selaginella moellendorffii]
MRGGGEQERQCGCGATATLIRKIFRKNLMRSDNYNRSGFGYKKETLERLDQEYNTSDMLKSLKENSYTWGDKQFPDQHIWLTNEIIHNPTVNQKLEEMEIKMIPVEDKVKDFSVVKEKDVVVFPAFGATVQEMQLLAEKKVQIVDTTCPWVAKVWNSVEKHKKSSYTSVIHGKYAHEETVATASFAGKYIIVKNMKEATYVCDYILGGKFDGSNGTKEELLEKSKYATSKGFDPDDDLVRVGIANQTTMLKGETEDIGKLLQRTMMQKYGVENTNDHFMSVNTICDATQQHVAPPRDGEINNIPSYWIDTEERIGPGNKIAYRLNHGELVEKENWFPTGPVTIGITSGASTPDKVVENVLKQVFQLKKQEALL